jgi:predicted enzyme related to lactoylglutathione lyase
VANQPRFGFVVEYVDDVATAKSFYTDVLGLTIDRESPEFIQFVDPAGVNHAIASDQSLLGGRDPEMYWVVDDATALFDRLASKADVSFPLTTKPFGTVFGLKDPAGQTQFFIEFVRERPSQAVS